MDKEILIAILLGIGLSASTGFRVFIPMLIAAIAGHFGYLHLGEGFYWLGSIPAIICLGVAALGEIAAYYIPIVDNFLDMIATPLAIAAGALLSISVLPIDNEMSKYIMGIIIGGGSAGVVQAGTSLTRLISSKMTLTTGNAIVSTGENVGAIGGALLSLVLPVLTGIAFLFLIIYILFKMKQWRKKRKTNTPF